MQVFLFYRPRSVIHDGLATYIESSLRQRFGSDAVREVAGVFSQEDGDQGAFLGQHAVLLAILGGGWQQPGQTESERRWDALFHAMVRDIPCIPVLLGDTPGADRSLILEPLAALLWQAPLRLTWGPALGPQLTRLYERIELGGSAGTGTTWAEQRGSMPPAYGPSSRPSMYGPSVLDSHSDLDDDEPVTTVLPTADVMRAIADVEMENVGGDSWARQPYGARRRPGGNANTPLSVPPAVPPAASCARFESHVSEGPLEGVLGSWPLWRLRVLGWGAVMMLTLTLYIGWFGLPTSVRRSLGFETVQLAASIPTPEFAPGAAVHPSSGAMPSGPIDLEQGASEEAEEPTPVASSVESRTASPSDSGLKEPSRQHVMSAIRSVQEDARACGYKGATFVNVTVEGRSGRVINAAADRSIGEVSQCIARAVRRARFPQFAKPEFRIKLLLRL